MAQRNDSTRGRTRWARCLALVALIALVLCGCRDATEQALSAQPIVATQPQAIAPTLPAFEVTQPWRVGFVTKTGDPSSAYWQLATQGAIAAAEAAGVELVVLHPQSETDVVGQLAHVDRLVAAGVDAIVLAPTSSQLLAPAVVRAREAGIAVVAFDTPLNSDAPQAFVGVDNVAAAQRAGAWVASQLPPGARVALLLGAEAQQNAVERRDGFLLGLRSVDVSIVGLASANWDRATAYSVARDWLERFDDLDAIVASNDEMALGAAQAAAALGRTEVIITGYDGSPEARGALADGSLAATVDQAPAAQAAIAVRAALAILEHVDVPARLEFEAPLLLRPGAL